MAKNEVISKKTVRCAIYTRKSVSEGLDMEFNTLDAQREAAESFILSQRHEGWECLPDRYDDGGYTGGNMDRPAFKRLMSDVKHGRVDCIIVYKVDRLSRSLMDFSTIMGVIEAHNCSFVSVTQQFNTSNSMGRLTLNVLLSFAQFEREIISERTRDKIQASRRKGKWTGGMQFLGYDVRDGRLEVNEVEAKQVRELFHSYLQMKSIVELCHWANVKGYRTKRYTSNTGNFHPGKGFSKSSMNRLLRNVYYIGKVPLKDDVYDGEQEAIIDEDLWNKVQDKLDRNQLRQKKERPNKYHALLTGLIYAEPGLTPMHHRFTIKQNKRYRYYVNAAVQTERSSNPVKTRYINAHEIESFVIDHIKKIGKDKGLSSEIVYRAKEQHERDYRDLCMHEQRLQQSLNNKQLHLHNLLANPNATEQGITQARDTVFQLEADLKRTREKITHSQGRTFDEEAVLNALENFDQLWNAMQGKERVRLIKLLIEKVTYNAETEEVNITFRRSGIHNILKSTAA